MSTAAAIEVERVVTILNGTGSAKIARTLSLPDNGIDWNDVLTVMAKEEPTNDGIYQKLLDMGAAPASMPPNLRNLEIGESFRMDDGIERTAFSATHVTYGHTTNLFLHPFVRDQRNFALSLVGFDDSRIGSKRLQFVDQQDLTKYSLPLALSARGILLQRAR